ncbi:hypothetical protein FQA39_LY00857 [Lamprigera yunnana]|nr:hypothetical protein FQA39_LY00857 [Lamprigera yunnana]
MQFYQRYKKIINLSGIVIFTSSVGWVLAEIRGTYKILNNVLDTSIVNFLEPPKHQEFQKDVNDSSMFSNWINSKRTISEDSHSLWKFLKFTYAQQILKLTTSDAGFLREKIINQLASIKNLENWHYSYLSQLIDAKTAVGLALTKNVDKRYFTNPAFKYVAYSHDMLVSSMKDLLITLHSKSPHACMEYFISKAFVDQDVEHNFIEHNPTSSELRKLINAASDILPLCLDTLLHHATLGDNARDLTISDGLHLLMEVYNRFRDNFEVKLKLCNIVSSLSVFPELLDDLYKAGWITALAEWINDCDVRLSATAAKTLLNLDNNKYSAVYPNKIYILHPLHRVRDTALVDVVFVHGLLGGVFFTWRQHRQNVFKNFFSVSTIKKTLSDVQSKLLRTSDPTIREYIQDAEVVEQLDDDQVGHDFEFVLNDIPLSTNNEAKGPYTCSGTHMCVSQAQNDCFSHTMCWPKDWLSEDCKNLRILGINYDTNLSMWAKMCPNSQEKATIEERSDEFLYKLLNAGVGERPIIWVTHSMGGIIVKNLLHKAWESKSDDVKKICSNSKGIIFYSTPHTGSRVATLNQPTALLLWPSVEIQELREDSAALLKTHENFLKLAQNVPLKIVSFVETKSTLVTALKFNLLFVDPNSGNPTIGEYFEVPQDHLGICKPVNRMSFLYQKVLHFIKEIVDEEPEQESTMIDSCVF